MDPVFDPKTSFGKKFRRFQEWSVTNLRWPMPIFNARGIFQYSFGTIPHRLPITVVGKFLALKLWSFLGSLLIYLLNYIIIEALLCSPKIQHFTNRNHWFGAAVFFVLFWIFGKVQRAIISLFFPNKVNELMLIFSMLPTPRLLFCKTIVLLVIKRLLWLQGVVVW